MGNATATAVRSRQHAARSAASAAAEMVTIVPGLAEDLGELEEFDHRVGTFHGRRAVTVVRILARCIAHAAAAIPSAAAVRAGRGGWDASAVGFSEARSEIAAALRMSEVSAANLINHSELLIDRFTATHQALLEGRVSYWHTVKLLDEATSLPEPAWPAFEAAVLPFAEQLTVAKFEKKARQLRERLHPDSISERHLKAVTDRRVWLSAERDGMATIGIYTTAVTAHAIHNRSTMIARILQGADEFRTAMQLQHDV